MVSSELWFVPNFWVELYYFSLEVSPLKTFIHIGVTLDYQEVFIIQLCDYKVPLYYFSMLTVIYINNGIKASLQPYE